MKILKKISGEEYKKAIIYISLADPQQVDVAYNITNGTLKLECSPTGVLNNYTFVQLEHRSEFYEHIRYLNSSNDGSLLSASIEDVGLQDTGIYNDQGSLFVASFTIKKKQLLYYKYSINIEDAPVFLGGDIIRFGEVISISTVVYSGHGIRINATIQSNRNIIHKLKINRSFVRKMFHGSNISLNASQVSFQLDLMTQKNLTKYILEICNTYVCRDIKIDIRIETSKIQGSTRSKYQDVEIVFAALAVLSVLGIGMGVAFLIWKRGYLSGSHLNYSEVVFEAGPSSIANIIHGANDKTIYSEIDLASSARFHHDCSDTSSDEDFIYIDGIVNLERKNEMK
ncbi:unnamed protein product [Mytilus coruscus]|uniref:Uncharacterized protein n=1 Tax=Mytilus coruscus TaxID=42192 RepID=A0A6J8BQZ9_MYTCO|nr:unnamed protein product [Mytilus coruscus]